MPELAASMANPTRNVNPTHRSVNPLESQVKIGPLIVISGPSGVGKTTVVTRLLESTTLPLRRVVTATTRAPRQGEVDNRDYHFWTPERFHDALQRDEMVEHAQYGGKWYGTPKNEVEPFRVQGMGVILVIDVQGATQVRSLYPDDHLSIFIRPPSHDELVVRLRSRASESSEQLARRLAIAEHELEAADAFHKQLVNDTLDKTVQELDNIIWQQFRQRGMR